MFLTALPTAWCNRSAAQAHYVFRRMSPAGRYIDRGPPVRSMSGSKVSKTYRAATEDNR